MAVFFLLVGLEIKQDVLSGELSTGSARILPMLGAFGGMLIPALIHVAFNARSPELCRSIGEFVGVVWDLGVPHCMRTCLDGPMVIRPRTALSERIQSRRPCSMARS